MVKTQKVFKQSKEIILNMSKLQNVKTVKMLFFLVKTQKIKIVNMQKSKMVKKLKF